MAFALITFAMSIFVLVLTQTGFTDAQLGIGVNYGLIADNLPPPAAVINLFKKNNIGKIRIFDPNQDVLNALRGSNIVVTVGVRNQDLQSVSSSVASAKLWFDNNIEPFMNSVNFSYITVGNEVVPGDLAQYVLPAMQNLKAVVDGYKYSGVRITTVVATNVLGNSYPPSSGVFSQDSLRYMVGIIGFLSSTSSPLMINVYPYFAWASDPVHVRLDYAQFTAPGTVVQDGNLGYQNLFDAILDAHFWAMEKLGVTTVDLVVSESGWPSAGNGNFTTPNLAQVYNVKFVNKIIKRIGTPKMPNAIIEGFVFAMFNEDQKPVGVEQNFGLFYPDQRPVYDVFGLIS